jgi:5-methylcytosine-specific restriction endonuclease McrA
MGKHLPPQLREPRTYWYGRTLWKHRRRDQLQREPLCQPCLRKGRVVPATDVHHLIEFGDVWNLFVTAPLESRCKACHAEAHGRRNPARHRAIGLDGWPTS